MQASDPSASMQGRTSQNAVAGPFQAEAGIPAGSGSGPAAVCVCEQGAKGGDGAEGEGDAQGGVGVTLLQRERNEEVEANEWMRRHAELEKQRLAVQAERQARAERAAVERARAEMQRQAHEMEERDAMRTVVQQELRRIVLPGMSLRQALAVLGFQPRAGATGEKAAFRQARVFHHPDSSRRRGDSMQQQCMSEEIFKLLGTLT